MPSPETINPLAALSAELAATVERLALHGVEIQSPRSRASGFVWRDGLIVTAAETLAEEGRISSSC